MVQTEKGVYGYASNLGNVTNYGGYFRANGAYGRGVYGHAFSTSSSVNYGGYFQADGTAGTGVYGYASSNGSSFFNYGGHFRSDAKRGFGVLGEATNTGEDEINVGGYFTAAGANGRGVSGHASNSGDVTNYGGFFSASGGSSRGVYGSGKAYAFYANSEGADYGPFTGAHEVKFGTDIAEEIVPGLIVSATGTAEVRKNEDGKTSLSSTLPTVTISAKEKDKAVFGVIVSQ